MDDRQLTEDLLDINLEDILNLTFDLDSLNSIHEISNQWLDELTSSVTNENNVISASYATIQKDRTADAFTETVGAINQLNPEYIDLEKNHNPDQPSNQVEIIILSDAVKNGAPLSPPTVDLQKENITSDSLWMQNSDLLTKTTEPRICLSKDELSVLEREFQICHYPDRFTRKRLALTLNLSRLTVSEWFTNRRIKMRKQSSGNVEENGETNKISISKDQVAMLEREFEKSQYPDCLTRQKLSLMLGLRDVTVKNWFHNRRVKMRKLMEQAQSASLQIQFNTLSAPETLSQRQDLTEKTDVNNNELATVEQVLEKQETHYDTLCESVSPYIFVNQQIQEPQNKTSNLSPSLGSNQSSEQRISETLVELAQPRIETYPQIENSISLSNRPPNRKRTRTNFSKSQLSVLENQFIKCKYPDFDTICQLASTINVTNDNVRNWFKNRRSKRKHLEKDSQITQPQTKTVSLSQTNSLSTEKCKRTSSRRSRLGTLEREFKKCPYPDLIKLCQLASKTKFTNSQVRRWFTHRRAKQGLLEKHAKKIEQAKRERSNFSLTTGSFEQNCRTKVTKLNTNQLAVLEREFSVCHYPRSRTREKLALALNLTFPKVSKWFENRRKKEQKIRDYNTETSGFLRQNTDFNEKQLAMLEDEFKKCQYADYETCMYLASIVNMPYTCISEWFSNRRAKEGTPETWLLSRASRQQYCARKIHFSKSQLAVLENAFARCPYLDYDTTCFLSATINVSYERVRTWFTNRRSKQRQLNKYGQLLQSLTETSRFLLSSETNLIEAQSHERQIPPFQNYRPPSMVGVDCCNNAFCNNVQQMRVYPQNLRFGWYSSVSSLFIPHSYGMTAFPPIQEDSFDINPAAPSAQYVYSQSYDAPMPNHSFLAEL